MDYRSFMMERVDGEFYLVSEGGVGDVEGSSPSTIYVNNETLVIYAELLTSVPPSLFVENTIDSDNAPSQKDKVILVGRAIADKAKNQKVPPQGSKSFGDPSDPLDVDSDPDIHELKEFAYCHWVVAHVTPPFWKQHLKEISLEKLYDIHDKAYMRQVILDNVMNRRTPELKVKCNDALQYIDKNPLVLDMCVEIETLQGQVNRLHGEYNRLVLEEKKWVNYEQTLVTLRSIVDGLEAKRERLNKSDTQLLQEVDGLKQDRVALIAKVIPYVATELVRSDKIGLLVARLVKIDLFHRRCSAFEEVAALKEPFELEKMFGYRPLLKREFHQAGDNLDTASYLFLTEAISDLYAPLRVFLSKNPKSLRSKSALSQSSSKPLS
ncbi:hypothetical protein Tco_0909581 [Tanacetum coccineum]|uniref:Uncharacterized protein n=1 Tax=Tanacetum coccineum TaxID=301880 RepID=A0ABQ5CQE5_9ASTR